MNLPLRESVEPMHHITDVTVSSYVIRVEAAAASSGYVFVVLRVLKNGDELGYVSTMMDHRHIVKGSNLHSNSRNTKLKDVVEHGRVHLLKPELNWDMKKWLLHVIGHETTKDQFLAAWKKIVNRYLPELEKNPRKPSSVDKCPAVAFNHRMLRSEKAEIHPDYVRESTETRLLSALYG